MKQLTTALPDELYDNLKIRAITEKVTLKSLVARILTEYLKKVNKRKD